MQIMESLLKHYMLAVLLQYCCKRLKGALVISPSGIVPVCSGDQLELVCNSTRSPLEWRLNVPNVARVYRSGIASDLSETGGEIQINSTTITFSRITNTNEVPLLSRLLIDSVNVSLNGTEVICEDVTTLESASTTITIIPNNRKDLAMDPEVVKNVIKQVKFESDGFMVSLEWTEENVLYTYYVNVIPPTPFVFIDGTSVTFNMSYSTTYNVSVLVELRPLCGKNITVFRDLYYYSKCENPRSNTTTNENVTMSLHPGSTLYYTCPGSKLTGSQNTTCKDNGQWIPQINCQNFTQVVMNGMEPTTQLNFSTVLGSVFGASFLLLVITITGILVALFFKAKIKGPNRPFEEKAQYECSRVNASVELHATESKIAPGGVVYADIDQSLFNQQLHQRNIIVPPLDDSPIEYAKIKHTGKPSVSQKIQSTVKEEFINGPESDDSLKQNVNLDNLLFQLRPKVTPAWYQFGEAAGVEKEVLDKFAKHCSLDDCVVETLDYWLRQREKPPTWSDVAEILRAIKLPQLALEIASMIYKTGKLPIEVDMDWIPQVDSESVESPPPIPPKMSESTTLHPVPQNFESGVPALPPKPTGTSANHTMCGITTDINVPPRPPKT